MPPPAAPETAASGSPNPPLRTQRPCSAARTCVRASRRRRSADVRSIEHLQLWLNSLHAAELSPDTDLKTDGNLRLFKPGGIVVRSGYNSGTPVETRIIERMLMPDLSSSATRSPLCGAVIRTLRCGPNVGQYAKRIAKKSN